jgi:hypothetical protein
MSLDGETHAVPHAHKTRHKWLDMIVAFSALFVSVVSLGVAIRMAEANARLVSASSWPFLSYGAGTETANGMTKIHMRVFNVGVGPAKIESAELVWKGVAYARDQDFLKACCGLETASQPDFDSDLLPAEVLRAGERIEFLRFTESANPMVFAALQRAPSSNPACCARRRPYRASQAELPPHSENIWGPYDDVLCRSA